MTLTPTSVTLSTLNFLTPLPVAAAAILEKRQVRAWTLKLQPNLYVVPVEVALVGDLHASGFL